MFIVTSIGSLVLFLWGVRGGLLYLGVGAGLALVVMALVFFVVASLKSKQGVSIKELAENKHPLLEAKQGQETIEYDLPTRGAVPIASTQKAAIESTETHPPILQREHNLISLGAKPEILVEQNHTFRELRENDGLRNYSNYAIIVEFENKPVAGRQIHPLESVEAQIFFYDVNGKERRYIERGTWVGERYGYTTFKVGSRRKLVVAFNSNDQQEVLTWAVNNNRDTSYPNLDPSYFRLTDKCLRVSVRLVAQGEVVGGDEFTITTDPQLAIEQNQVTDTESNQTNKEARTREHIIELLKELVNEEHRVNAADYQNNLTLAYAAPMNHSNRVERFLTDHADYLGDDAVQRYQEKRVIALEEMLKESLRKS